MSHWGTQHMAAGASDRLTPLFNVATPQPPTQPATGGKWEKNLDSPLQTEHCKKPLKAQAVA